MKQSAPEIIPSYIECSYYDLRTDYIWQYIAKGPEKRLLDEYLIPGPESFKVMSDMLKSRNLTISDFIAEWQNTEHPELQECNYNERSGILRLKSRTFTFEHRTKTNEYHYVVRADVAKYCRLKKRETRKMYKNGGLFALGHLSELDEQLYSRYDAARKLEAWKRSRQRKVDIDYCRAMLPYLEQQGRAYEKVLKTKAGQALNIILEGNDRVRIGFVELYSPEEMHALPSYSREDWQLGIDKSLLQLKAAYDNEVEQIRDEMTALSEELRQIILGNAPINPDMVHERYSLKEKDPCCSYEQVLLDDAFGIRQETKKWLHQEQLYQETFYFSWIALDSDRKVTGRFEAKTFIYETTRTGKHATITMKDEALAKALNIDMVSEVASRKNYPVMKGMLREYDDFIAENYRRYLHCQAKRQQPQHQQLVEALQHIIQVTSPIVAYAGTNKTIQEKYSLSWKLEEDDRITVEARFCLGGGQQTFALEDYRSQVRVWWSQLLLKECKCAKERSIHPEDYLLPDLPF